MSNPFQEHLRAAEFSDDRLSQLSRASLQAAERKFFPATNPTLTIDVVGEEVDAYVNARVSIALVESTAHFAKATTDAKTAPRITSQFRNSLGIQNLGSSGNRVVLGFNTPDESPGKPSLIDRGGTLSLAEAAAQTLTRVLPESDGDVNSLEAAGGLLIPQRIGLRRLAETLTDLDRKIGISLQVRTGETLVGQLSTEQARTLRSSLQETSLDTKQVEMIGVLDGMRTRRQLFFMDTIRGQSILGTVDEEILPELRQFIGMQVAASLTVYQQIRADGRRGRKSYRLNSIRPAPVQPSLPEAIN